jgi:hypothetical protein
MKKLILLLFIIFLFSCEKKEPTYCWRCETYDKIFHYTLDPVNYCEKTAAEIIEIENKGSGIFATTKCTRY